MLCQCQYIVINAVTLPFPSARVHRDLPLWGLFTRPAGMHPSAWAVHRLHLFALVRALLIVLCYIQKENVKPTFSYNYVRLDPAFP